MRDELVEFVGGFTLVPFHSIFEMEIRPQVGTNTVSCCVMGSAADALSAAAGRDGLTLRLVRTVKRWDHVHGSSEIGLYTLISVSQDGRMLFDATRCPLHERAMLRCLVPLVYGFPSKDMVDFADTAESLFPYGIEFLPGGCCLGPAQGSFAFLCYDCVAAARKWQAEHPGFRVPINTEPPRPAEPSSAGAPEGR